MNLPEAEIERSFPLIITDGNENDTTNAASTVNFSGAAADSNLSVSSTTEEEESDDSSSSSTI